MQAHLEVTISAQQGVESGPEGKLSITLNMGLGELKEQGAGQPMLDDVARFLPDCQYALAP